MKIASPTLAQPEPPAMPAPKPKPLGLSDTQFTQLINCAEQLHPLDRDPFLRSVAKLFAGRDELGDGEFARGLRGLLRNGYFKPAPGGPPMPIHSRRKVGSAIA
jgi:hypothetical protein